MAATESIIAKLETARKDLLDLTNRNRLIHTPRNSTRSGRLEIVDELSQQVFTHLVCEKKSMSFLPTKIPEKDDSQNALSEQDLLSQPEDDELENLGYEPNHTDDRLQTLLNSDKLQNRLLKLSNDARTVEEEQGVNILYLALGFLKWHDADHSDQIRQAPLILIPVKLDRQSADSRFKIRYTEEDISANLSLQEKLKADFGIALPEISEVEEFLPDEYFEAVRKAVSSQKKWEVLSNDILLWLFSFSKFLMFRDLCPQAWPEDRQLKDHPLVSGLLESGFLSEPPLFSEEQSLDSVLQPIDMTHILDADSSQTIAIEEIRQGRSLVVQGPPGTGKSQTIANMIAAAVKQGKTVLFVAEKMAALEVVNRRLTQSGLGEMCLELHSNKANKRQVLEELGRTLQLGRPQTNGFMRQAEHLKAERDKLNEYVQAMHSPLKSSNFTPYQIIGELVRLRGKEIPPSNFKLTNPCDWSKGQFDRRTRLVQDYVRALEQVGNPQSHHWRGVELDVVLPMDIDRWIAAARRLIPRLERLIAVTAQLANLLHVDPVATPTHSKDLASLTQRLATAPEMDRKSIGNPVWAERRKEIDDLVNAGVVLSTIQTKLAETVTPAGWSTDMTLARGELAAYGRSWFRVFRRDYRNALASLRSILVNAPPKPLALRLEILDALLCGQSALASIESGSNKQHGRDAFGDHWQGACSDWSKLSAIAEWEADLRKQYTSLDFRRIYAALADKAQAICLDQQIRSDFKPVLEETLKIFAEMKVNIKTAFGIDKRQDIITLPWTTLKNRLEMWIADPASLTKWVQYCRLRQQTAEEGMKELVDQADRGSLKVSELTDLFQMAYYEALIRESFRHSPELAQFNGDSHEQILKQFRELDLERIRLARQEVALAHYEKIPKDQTNAGEVGVVRRELEKKRRHMPLRKLLKEAVRAVQAIKPVFMMSPISVAQYLEPGAIEFDLLLIDEASQVKPIDAMGAVARARQIVVVGDDKQLPPTQFFNSVLSNDDSDATDADDFQASDVESILGMCLAQNMSRQMLRWHYRSRHHSLIAVSNHEFYDDKLYVVPSPEKHSSHLGLRYCLISDGVFDRGGSATNRREAEIVADAVIDHARNFPEKSLGVGTFSMAQRDAIIDELELRRRREPGLERFFSLSNAEPFFVKNLETIQGDERDFIFISIGYGKDASGYMAMTFGPLATEGGERRLNVLISRSKEQCVVFSSITAEDIDLHRAKSRGAKALKTFLTYAQSGVLGTAAQSNRDYDSEFEREVANALMRHGYQMEPQVGIAGFFIDLAVVDQEMPGRYLLGIECDGAAYHSSRSARDRDRLRQQVLEDHGWKIHRIWSTDWFHDPEGQLRKTLLAIENAKTEWAKPSDTKVSQIEKVSLQTEVIQRDETNGETLNNSQSAKAEPYVVAEFSVPNDRPIHEIDIDQMAEIVADIVKIEGPIHQDEIARRVTALWGQKRTGQRIQEAVKRSLERAEVSRKIGCDGSFYFIMGQQHNLTVRNRENVIFSTLRQPEMLPPAEVRFAIQTVVTSLLGVSMDEAIIQSARLLGFQTTSAQLRVIISNEIVWLIENSLLTQRDDKLTIPASVP